MIHYSLNISKCNCFFCLLLKEMFWLSGYVTSFDFIFLDVSLQKCNFYQIFRLRSKISWEPGSQVPRHHPTLQLIHPQSNMENQVWHAMLRSMQTVLGFCNFVCKFFRKHLRDLLGVFFKGAFKYYVIRFSTILDPPRPLRHQNHHRTRPPTPPPKLMT